MSEASGADQADVALIAGIQGQNVHDTAVDLLAMPGRHANAQLAIKACGKISENVCALREVVFDSLRWAGVDASLEVGPEDTGHLQFHATSLIVPRGQFSKSALVMQELGFRTAVELSEARLKILQKTARSVRFVRFDATSIRLDLKLAEPPASVLPKVFHPRMLDLGVVDLPKRLSAAYWFLRPWRIMQDRLLGVTPRVGENDLLGTPDSLIPALLDPLRLGGDDVFVDLGCGDGRVLAEAARSGCRAIGYEIDVSLVKSARARCGEGVTILHGSAEDADLSSATVVFMFLPLHLMERLLPEILDRVPPSTRVVSHEQLKPRRVSAPEQVFPVFSADAMSVAHIWRGRQSS